jgi:hypothetical protein
VLTAAAARALPSSRRSDADVVRDCAREAIAAHGPAVLMRESVSLVTAGLRARAGATARDLVHAPWREALTALALPLATALLLVWTFGFVPHYDHWPMGFGWTMLLGGSLVAVVGAALRSRWLTVGGATVVFLAAAAPYIGFGTEGSVSGTPSFFAGANVDFGAASLLPTLLLIAAGLSFSRTGLPASDGAAGTSGHRLGWVASRLTVGVIPSVIAAVALLPTSTPKPTHRFMIVAGGPDTVREVPITGPPYFAPWAPPSRWLTVVLAVALGLAIVVTWTRARARPERALATGIVLVTIAYPVAWALTRTEALNFPWWMLNNPWPFVVMIAPMLIALALIRRGAHERARS